MAASSTSRIKKIIIFAPSMSNRSLWTSNEPKGTQTAARAFGLLVSYRASCQNIIHVDRRRALRLLCGAARGHTSQKWPQQSSASKNCGDNPLAAVAAAATAAVAAPAVARGLKLTTAFLASLRTSKRHGRIDGYNDLHNKEEADDRNDQYADLVDYDLATSSTSGAGAELPLRGSERAGDLRAVATPTRVLPRQSRLASEGRGLRARLRLWHWGTGPEHRAVHARASHGHHDQPVPGGSRECAVQAGG